MATACPHLTQARAREALLDTGVPVESRGIPLPAGEGPTAEAGRPRLRPHALRLRHGPRRHALLAGGAGHAPGARVKAPYEGMMWVTYGALLKQLLECCYSFI